MIFKNQPHVDIDGCLQYKIPIKILYRYRADTQTYQPYNKDWIKEKIYVLLRRQAQQAAK